MPAKKSNVRIGATDGGAPTRVDHSNGLAIKNSGARANRNDHDHAYIGAPTLEDHSTGLAIKNSGAGANRNDQDEVQDHAVSVSQRRVCCGCFGGDVIRISERDRLYQSIESQLISGVNSAGMCTQVVVIHQNVFQNSRKQAKLQCFKIFLQSMKKLYGSNANVTHAWYGPASKDEICKIISHGFGDSLSNGIYGRGIYLSPADFPLGSVQSSIADENGLRHLLLCRVILGRMELVRPGSQQSHPTSVEFDSGVGDLSSPTKYIIWGTHTNTHILPEFVISFRPSTGQKISNPHREPNSTQTSFSIVLSELSKVLPPCSIDLINEYHHDYEQKKITKMEFEKRMSEIAGQSFLDAILEGLY